MRNHVVAELEAEARYQRERLSLYRARAYGDLPTSAVHLRELERTSDGAEQRLRSARTARSEAEDETPGTPAKGTR